MIVQNDIKNHIKCFYLCRQQGITSWLKNDLLFDHLSSQFL